MRSTAALETDWVGDVLEEYQAALTRYAMRITGDLPDIPRAPRGDFDPRVLSSPLQELVFCKGDSEGS